MIITFLDLQILARKLFVIFFAISTQSTLYSLRSMPDVKALKFIYSFSV